MIRGTTKHNRLEANSSPIAEPSVKAVSLKRNKMSKTSEGLEPHLYFPIFGVDREIPPDEPGMECPHKTVVMEKLDGEDVLICEDCGEDLTEETIG